MLRTVTNVWSDCCGAAIIARTEGEAGIATGEIHEPIEEMEKAE